MPTDMWQGAGTGAAIMAVCGGLVALAIIAAGAFPDGAGFIPAATAGAGLAGALSVPLFGGEGARGWLWALAGAVLATLLGAGLAVIPVVNPAALAQEPQAILFGPKFVFGMLVVEPAIGLLWLGLMAAAHVVLRARRRALAGRAMPR